MHGPAVLRERTSMERTPPIIPRVVIGASAGGLPVLRTLVAQLPATFPAVLAIVVHIPPSRPSHLPTILQRQSQLPVAHASDGAALQPGHILIAPPDRHLLLAVDHVRVVLSPKEHRFRPAVDPLFRSAAAAAGPQTIGVVLSGGLSDGAAGLAAIQANGGVTIVQDPQDAAARWMPLAALRAVTSEYILPATALARVLVDLVHRMQ
jgi:two-component system, chemotaxis family, protein-glutamate methylesterase/glutaminase